MHQISDLDGILPETDILVMSLPETPETIHILNRERLALLPENAVVINVGRGSAIDEPALAEALKSGVIAGAALDVLEKEPMSPDTPLKTAESFARYLHRPHPSRVAAAACGRR